MVKRILSFISIIAILFVATGCINITSTIESIEVDKTTIPTEVTVGDFLLSEIEVIVHRTDNTSYKKTVTKSMLSTEAWEKLKKPGTHNIYVRYEGKLDLMTIVLLDKYPDITIFFETNSGSEINDQVISKNSKVSRPSNPTKTGYVFGGWFTDVEMEHEFSFTTVVKESLTLYAKWASRDNVITFNGGSQVFTFTVDVATGEKVLAPDNPVREGYTFDAWYIDSGFINLYNFDNIVRNSFTLYGKWIPEEYTISFNSNGGTELADVTVLREQLLSEPLDLVKAGFEIEGWYLNSALTEKYNFATLVTQNFTLYAKWKIAEWTVTFATNGGLPISSVKVNHGGMVSSLTDPMRQDYTFGGWYLNSQLSAAFSPTMVITENITLYAKWTRITYTMNFNSDGGTPVGAKIILSGEVVNKPTDPVKQGLLFAGWYIDSGLTTLYNWAGAVRNDVNLYARWAVNPNIPQETYTIIFDTDGGSEVGFIEVVENEKAVLPTNPTKTGYTFGGWYVDITDEYAFDINTPIIHDYVFIAKWLSNHTVTFLDHVSNIIKVQTVGDGLAAIAPIPPVRPGYDFKFWDVAFSEVRYNLTIRPLYVVSTYQIIFKDADGAVLSEQTIEYGSNAILPSDPTLLNPQGYHFIGWDKVTTNVSSDLVVTAKYAINTYTVNYADANGNILKTQEVPHNGKAINITVDVPYLELLGWYNTNALSTIFRFDTTIITANITIYGKFAFGSKIMYETTSLTPNTIRILSWDVQGITDLIVPEYLNGLKVTSLGNLVNTTNLRSITLPKSLGEIEVSYPSLRAISSLETIIIANDAPNFATVNGVLYNKAKTNLLLYPKGKTDIEFTL
ncbi:MAG TPA: InlB B-repeat-containing protein, partial [Bacilli bacterium]|nr:InlB B-repeat-containing protein [Bacilli bacterium]